MGRAGLYICTVSAQRRTSISNTGPTVILNTANQGLSLQSSPTGQLILLIRPSTRKRPDLCLATLSQENSYRDLKLILEGRNERNDDSMR